MAQVRETPRDGAIGYGTDDWGGYPASRTRPPQYIHTSRVANPVVMGGAMRVGTSDLGGIAIEVLVPVPGGTDE